MNQTRIDTGDNKPAGKHVLRDACKIVVFRGASLVCPVTDVVGERFAYKFKSRYGRDFYLVARSVEPYGKDQLVSTQEWLVRRAARNHCPLVMLIARKGLYVFNPLTILKVFFGQNKRCKEHYLNWQFWYGEEWTEDKKLFEIWRKLKPVGATPQGLPLSMFSNGSET